MNNANEKQIGAEAPSDGSVCLTPQPTHDTDWHESCAARGVTSRGIGCGASLGSFLASGFVYQVLHCLFRPFYYFRLVRWFVSLNPTIHHFLLLCQASAICRGNSQSALACINNPNSPGKIAFYSNYTLPLPYPKNEKMDAKAWGPLPSISHQTPTQDKLCPQSQHLPRKSV
jgi:hypothetical protein